MPNFCLTAPLTIVIKYLSSGLFKFFQFAVIAIDIWADDEDEEDDEDDDDEDVDYEMFFSHFDVIVIDIWTEKTFILRYRCAQALSKKKSKT